MIKRTQQHQINDLLIVFFICLLPRVYVSLRAYPVMVISDEVSAMSAAAFAAGFNWRDVVSQAGYYGFGLLFAFAPLFRLVQSPIWVYRIIMFGLSVVEALTAVMCYKTLLLVKPDFHRIYKILISCVCGLVNILSTVNISNRSEEALALVVWITVYLLVKIILCTESKHRVKYEFAMLIVLTWSLTLHTRAVMLFLGILAVTALYFLLWHRVLLHGWVYILMVVGYLAASRFIKLYQSQIWTGIARNSSMTTASSGFLSLIKSEGINYHTIVSFLRIVVGQLYTACVMTGGLYIIAIVAFLWRCFPLKKNKENEKTCAVFVAGAFAFVCTFGTSLGQGLTWLPGVYYDSEYGYKAFTYMRYFGVYVSPLIMCGLIALQEEKGNIKRIALVSGIGIVLLTIAWQIKIYPMLINTTWHTGSDWQFMYLGGMQSGVRSTASNWLLASMLLLEIVVLSCVLLCKQRERWFLLFLIVFLMGERIYTFDYRMLHDEQYAYNLGNAGYEFVTALKDLIPLDEIYVYDASDKTDHQNFYIYQFLNFEHHIIPTLPETDDFRFVFTNEVLEDELPACWYTQLDSNEYVFIRDYADMVKIRKKGYTIQMNGNE